MIVLLVRKAFFNQVFASDLISLVSATHTVKNYFGNIRNISLYSCTLFT